MPADHLVFACCWALWEAYSVSARFFIIFSFRDQIRHAQSLADDNKSIIGTGRVGLISPRTLCGQRSLRALFKTEGLKFLFALGLH